MADLIPSGRRGERGQLLLIAAFIIATSFVVLALVVNSAIFTENLATRDDVAGSQDALQHRHEVEQSLGTIVEELNEDNSIGANPTRANDNLEQINQQGGLQQSARGRVVQIEIASVDPGIKVAQDRPGNFSDANAGAADWTVADDVNHTRNFQVNITDHSELTNTANAFKMILNGTNDKRWNLTIADPSPATATDEVEVQVNPPGEPAQSCIREFGDSMVIDITSATIDGEQCYWLDRDGSGNPRWYGANVDRPYRIDFTNVDKIEATYSFIVDGTADVDTFQVPPHPSTDQPYQNLAIYNLTAAYEYHTTAVGYETDIRVAPGEAPP